MTAEEPTRPVERPLHRPAQGRWIAGVAAGLSNRFRIPVWIVRTAFVLAATTAFWMPLPELENLLDITWMMLSIDVLLLSTFGDPLLPLSFGLVIYLMGWIIIPKEGAEVPGSESGSAWSSYWGRAIIYLMATLIGSWLGTLYGEVLYSLRYYTSRDVFIVIERMLLWIFRLDNSNYPFETIFLFAWAYLPSILVLAAARFRTLGTVLSATVSCLTVSLMWLVVIHTMGTAAARDLIVINTLTVPLALAVTATTEWRRRRRPAVTIGDPKET